LFKVIRSSINQIWGIPHAPRKVLSTIKSRSKALLIIFIAGVLFSIGIFVETIQVVIGEYFYTILPSFSKLFNSFLAFVISTITIALWFLFVFRYLADKRPSWHVAWVGALFTSCLFSVGKILLHILLDYNNINTIYGASASIVLLLLFVFYTSMILYFGAAFTRMWELHKDGRDSAPM